MSLRTLLGQLVTVQVQTNTKDSSGGMVKAWADVSGKVKVPASIQAASSNVALVYQQKGAFVSHTVYTQANLGATTLHRLKDSAGNTYLVHGPTRDESAGRGKVFATDVEIRVQ